MTLYITQKLWFVCRSSSQQTMRWRNRTWRRTCVDWPTWSPLRRRSIVLVCQYDACPDLCQQVSRQELLSQWVLMLQLLLTFIQTDSKARSVNTMQSVGRLAVQLHYRHTDQLCKNVFSSYVKAALLRRSHWGDCIWHFREDRKQLQ